MDITLITRNYVKGDGQKEPRQYDSIEEFSKKCKLMYSDKKPVRGCLGRGEGGEEAGFTKENNVSGVMEIFIILTVVMVSWVYTHHTKHIQQYILKMYTLCSYSSVKLNRVQQSCFQKKF